jgi:2-polyprenyl-6-methoxyphenol hydroxylase-like FAD-dependent oxidoreductase
MERKRAVVVGGSVAGLTAASVLATRMAEVVLVERHEPSPARPSTSGQGHLPHVLLAAGARVFEELHPGFADELVAQGALTGPDPTRVPCYWLAAGTLRGHLALPDLGFARALCSRGLVEKTLRRRTLALPNVRQVHATVSGLVTDGAHVTGVRLRDGEECPADLVVDASGRHTGIEHWLTERGLAAPTRTEVEVDLRYTAFLVPGDPRDFGGAAFAVVQNTATLSRIGVALPHEAGMWQVVLGGYFGDAAPTDPAGARRFAESLASPVLGPVASRTPVAEPSRYTFRSSLRRHWERLPRPLEGLCVVGDAFASFNPLYGQGMAAAALQAEALGKALDEVGAGPGLSRKYARAAARICDNPWTIATGADFAYAETKGRRAPGQALLNRYVDRVTRAAAADERVNRAFSEVQQLLAPPPALFRPSVLSRALRYGRRTGPSAHLPARQPAARGALQGRS